jgi:hypothetical protein
VYRISKRPVFETEKQIVDVKGKIFPGKNLGVLGFKDQRRFFHDAPYGRFDKGKNIGKQGTGGRRAVAKIRRGGVPQIVNKKFAVYKGVYAAGKKEAGNFRRRAPEGGPVGNEGFIFLRVQKKGIMNKIFGPHEGDHLSYAGFDKARKIVKGIGRAEFFGEDGPEKSGSAAGVFRDDDVKGPSRIVPPPFFKARRYEGDRPGKRRLADAGRGYVRPGYFPGGSFRVGPVYRAHRAYAAVLIGLALAPYYHRIITFAVKQGYKPFVHIDKNHIPAGSGKQRPDKGTAYAARPYLHQFHRVILIQ